MNVPSHADRWRSRGVGQGHLRRKGGAVGGSWGPDDLTSVGDGIGIGDADVDRAAAEGWRRREPPLAVRAVAACGSAARTLAAEAASRVEEGVLLRAVSDEEWVVVLGAADDLPWVDGARYLGWDAGALVPTTHEPVPSTSLWRAAVFDAGRNGTEAAADSATESDQGVGADSLLVLLPGHVLHAAMPERAADSVLLRARATPPSSDSRPGAPS